jgi:hypothetical protein
LLRGGDCFNRALDNWSPEMKLAYWFFARSDRRRAREFLQQICDERIAARRALDDATRRADRALKDAQALEQEQFRQEFFGRRNPVGAAFTPCNPWVCVLPKGFFRSEA